MECPTPRRMVVWLLAPALLVAVAGGHAYLVVAHHQTPWEGGGFGMFSTVDKRQARFVRCSLMTATDTARVRLPDHLDTYVDRLRARPSTARVTSLAQYLADATWVETADSTERARERGPGGSASPPYRFLPSHERSDRARAGVMAVRVEVWRYRFVDRPYGLKATSLTSATQRSSAE